MVRTGYGSVGYSPGQAISMPSVRALIVEMIFPDVPQQALRGYAAPTGRGELAKRPAGTPVSVKAANENSTNNKMV
jgi:hypothetical protein